MRVQSTPKPPVGKVGIVGMSNRKRNMFLRIRMTALELERFDKEYCKTRYKSRADFVLALIEKKPIIVINDIIPVLAELRYQGNNLNQIAHKLNGMGSVNSAAMSDLIKRWAKAYDMLTAIAVEVNKDAVVQRNKQ